MALPRFQRQNLNPRLLGEEIGDAFQTFVYELLRAEYPDLHRFPGQGRDGGIDLSETRAGSRTVVECKFVGADEFGQAQSRWREVSHRLAQHLAHPGGPSPGQAQYAPWYRTDPRIEEYVFCTSALLSTQEQLDRLHSEIAGFFLDLGRQHEHLAHLANLAIRILDWSDLERRLWEQPQILFRWLPSARPQGLVPLSESTMRGTFREYLTGEKLPFYSRKQHLAASPAPAGLNIADDRESPGLGRAGGRTRPGAAAAFSPLGRQVAAPLQGQAAADPGRSAGRVSGRGPVGHRRH